MSAQSVPRKTLIRLAEFLLDKYDEQKTFSPPENYFSILSYPLERDTNDKYFLQALKQLQRYIPSIKNIHPNDGYLDDKKTMIHIELTIDRQNLEKQLRAFVSNSPDRLIYKNEQGIFWFDGTKQMVSNDEDADYWKFFVLLYEIAMSDKNEDANGYFLAPYKKLRTAMIREGVISRDTTDKTFKQKIRNILKDQFDINSKSFGIPKPIFMGRQIIKIGRSSGVKLYNPLL